MTDIVPDVEVFPKTTFFGLDKASGQCFTLKKEYYPDIIEAFALSAGDLQREANLLIDGVSYPFTIRLIDQNRKKTRKLKPGSLPKRDVVQFGWKTSPETQIAIRKALSDAFKIIKSGEKNVTEMAIFKHIGGSKFELVKKSLRIDPVHGRIECNVPSSFVSRNLKLAEDRGNGEAKLYVGSVRREQEFDEFMLGWHPMNTYEIDHVDLLLYMQEIEPEFSANGVYKAVSKRLFNELFNKVDRFGDLRVDLSKHTDSSRYYIRGRNNAWTLLREVCIPLKTTIVVERKDVLEGYGDFKIRVLRAKEAQQKNPTSGQRIGTKKMRKIKRKRNGPVDSLDSRTIPTELKDKIWRRDQGMCQANWRIDPSLDKNMGDVCGDNEDLEFDHIVPFSRGGKTTYRNLQLLCKKHNRMKSDREL
jgi:5-methylcytosine-specific restriction endonuclease McrA